MFTKNWKKLYLIILPLFLLLIGLGLGQIALAADEACTNAATATPAGIGGTCEIISSCLTTQGTPTKALNAFTTDEEKTACITEFKGTTKDCFKSKCDGVWNRVCCKPKAAGGTTPPASGETKGGGGGSSVSIKPGDLSPVGEVDIPTLIGNIVKAALGITGSIALLLFVYGGFIILISQGDATKITKGKTAMIWAAIGILVIFGSYIFISYIITGLTSGAGGGGTGGDVCGSTYPGHSCMNIANGTDCKPDKCPGKTEIQCCVANP